ncbi:LytR/AlgR family response regulator transcription factor [Fulvivirga lutea]|uniref:LytTR family transcriptional regulator n=1 Tax=Fulvivirga lutea TaxID=2810512 RepID=A0A975A0B1_9BACT|nr:LytTR family DNA-binding domain-containing protein [Fulvivirga lutea]QSE97071.1 LytTR family transcriptional regulator [Fulvivirga lutea]
MSKLLNRRSLLYLFATLTLLIIFDASQQKFYVDTFQLSKDAIPFSEFFLNHLTRWLIWLLFAIPVLILSHKMFQSEYPDLKQLSHFKWIGLSLSSTLFAILPITILSIFGEKNASISFLPERFIFFIYQKGITFLLAYLAVILFVKMAAQSKMIEAQWVELENLKHGKGERKILVKHGDYTKPLPFKDICWIQADDYCVRIHTTDKSYYLRKSMKFLEKQLKPHGFVRVHRGALLNLDFIDSLHFESSKVKLSNEKVVKISKSGEQALKQVLDKVSL